MLAKKGGDRLALALEILELKCPATRIGALKEFLAWADTASAAPQLSQKSSPGSFGVLHRGHFEQAEPHNSRKPSPLGLSLSHVQRMFPCSLWP
jgi:hypothetical protein